VGLVGLAGAAGALSRYGVTLGLRRALGDGFPYGTLAANLLGCFLLGFAVEAGLSGGLLPKALRVPLTVGFLGAFTTFSTFAFDTVRLVELEQLGRAALNLGLNLGLGIALMVAGLALGRAVAS
jgi:CrcB protein